MELRQVLLSFFIFLASFMWTIPTYSIDLSNVKPSKNVVDLRRLPQESTFRIALRRLFNSLIGGRRDQVNPSGDESDAIEDKSQKIYERCFYPERSSLSTEQVEPIVNESLKLLVNHWESEKMPQSRAYLLDSNNVINSTRALKVFECTTEQLNSLEQDSKAATLSVLVTNLLKNQKAFTLTSEQLVPEPSRKNIPSPIGQQSFENSGQMN